MNRLVVPIIVLLACAGAYVSGTLLRGHDGGWEVESGGTNYLLRLCDFDRLESADCASVIGSEWGSFDAYFGSRRILVPTSLVGLVHFVAVAIWFAMLGRIPATATWLWQATMFYLACSLLGSAFLLAVMAFGLSQWCPPCVVAHALNVAIFLATVSVWRSSRREALAAGGRMLATGKACLQVEMPATDRVLPRRARTRLALWAVVTAMGASVSLWLYFDATLEVRRQWRKLSDIREKIDEMRNDPAFVLREFYAQPVVDIPEIPSSGEGFSLNVPRLVIFTDYECAACLCFESRRRDMIDSAFAGGLQVEYRHAPGGISDAPQTKGVAEPADETPLKSCRASEAARVQGGDEAFERLHRLLFVTPENRESRDYAALAARVGLDVERLLADMGSAGVRVRVREDIALAKRLGVSEAPTLFLNGRRVPLLCINSPVFWSAIANDMALRRADAGEQHAVARARP